MTAAGLALDLRAREVERPRLEAAAREGAVERRRLACVVRPAIDHTVRPKKIITVPARRA
jgi:hypothetical protein